MGRMMQEDLIAAIHASPWEGVLAITGGGSGAIERLLTTPGASGTVLEAVVPYAAASLTDWLGRAPERACDEATARAMAMRAFQRARELKPADSDPRRLFGVGCTASLTSDRPKRGEHRAHVAIQTAQRTAVLTLRFEKDRRTRAEEEQATAHGVVTLLAEVAGARGLDLSKTPDGIEASIESEEAPPAWTQLLLGERAAEAACVAEHGAPLPTEVPVCLLPGSFNPPHAGHEAIAGIAHRRTGRPVVCELSLTNVDKPPLDFLEVRRRLDALSPRPTWLTHAPTFVEKARLAPGVVFAVGADTIARIGDPAYYDGDPERRDAACRELATLGCRFLVFGRAEGDRFVTLADLDLPAPLRALCDEVDEQEFRHDISSTAVRSAD